MQNSMLMFSFSVFWQAILFSSEFGPIKQNRQFKLKFSNYINLNMQNSMAGVHFFSVLEWKYLFGQKNQNCQFELKVGT